ncbi:MAG: DUF302 domain-containing protein [Caldilineae bacterium]|nr:MAG: DUF302 domain-containing protein [Caldilineae bacterium]
MSDSYGLFKTVTLSYDDAVAAVTEALKSQGFGVLTTIDVKATLRKKLDVDFKPYVILGACNPRLAYRALQSENDIGLLLPCNVIVYDNQDGTSTVGILDPEKMMGFVGNPALEPIAAEARSLLQNALAQLDG